MASVWDVIAGVGDFLLQGGSAIYDRYYQAKTQKEQYAREDNAVQRRVADLEAAGLNPALANGSAAGAGSVVSRPNSEFGSALDTMSAINQIQSQKEQVNFQKKENEMADITLKSMRNDLVMKQMEQLNSLGFRVFPYMDRQNNILNYLYLGDTNKYGVYGPLGNPLFEYERNWYIQNQMNSAAMLQFDRDFYSRHQIFKNFVQPITGAVLQGGATAARMYGAFGPK